MKKEEGIMEGKIPTVSIIIPVYNAESFLARCVDSVLGQEYTDFELLLIDDGSKDRSGALCDAYAASDSRVRVFHKENAGVSAGPEPGPVRGPGHLYPVPGQRRLDDA